MAIRAVQCPNCQGKPELDDSKEFATCPYCGTEIMLHDTVVIKHTGTVKTMTGNLDRAKNRIILGNRAFVAGNYSEAYDFFTKGLEDIPDDINVIYRKGICAVYISDPENLRIAELMTALAAAREIANRTTGYSQTEITEIDRLIDDDLCKLLNYLRRENDSCSEELPSKNECLKQSARWCELANLYQAVSCGLSSQDAQEKILLSGVDFCDEVMKRRVRFRSGSSYNEETKRYEAGYSIYKIDGEQKKTICDIRAELADRYNNLPSRLKYKEKLKSDIEELENQIEELKEVRDQAQNKYEAAKDVFWDSNPELREQRDRKKKLPWISVGIGAIILAVGILLRDKGIGWLVVSAILFLSSFAVREDIWTEMVKRMEDEWFPADVKELGDTFDAAVARYTEKNNEYTEKKNELDSFEKSRK